MNSQNKSNETQKEESVTKENSPSFHFFVPLPPQYTCAVTSSIRLAKYQNLLYVVRYMLSHCRDQSHQQTVAFRSCAGFADLVFSKKKKKAEQA